MSRLEKVVVAGIVIIIVLFARSLILDTQYQGFIPDPVQINLASPVTVMISG